MQKEKDQISLRIGAMEIEMEVLQSSLEKANRRAEDAQKKLEKARNEVEDAEKAKEKAEVRALELQAQLLQQKEQKNWIIPKEALTLTSDEVGRGAYGCVKKATFRGLNVAAKVLHRALISEYNRQKFIREMSVATILHHPNLVLFIGATLDESPIIVTELLPTCLSNELDKGPLDDKSIHRIATDIALGLNYLHCNDPPIIHRDISSGNVLLEKTSSGWKAKLSDFGSTIYVSWKYTARPGTPAYAAPEANDASQQSVKMDTYSFGVVLIEMLTVIPPHSISRDEQMQKIRWQGMALLVRACCQKDPCNRPNMTSILSTLASLSLPS